MEYRRMGSSGLEVSTVGLGSTNFGRELNAEGTAAVVHAALDQGITFIATANVYGAAQAEGYIGRALEGRRPRAVLATKGGLRVAEGPNSSGNSRKHLMDQVEVSLRRLRTDYIDLYQIHSVDPHTPIEETLRALDDMVHQGKIRYIGCSNFSAWQTCEAIWTSRSLGLNAFVSVEIEYSLLNRSIEREMVPFCRAYKVGIIPYYPLASGFLTGKYRLGEPPPRGTRLAKPHPELMPSQQRLLTEANFRVLAALATFARERGHTVGELAFAWLLAQPQVATVIAGATKPEQVRENAKSAEWPLTAEELKELERALEAAR